MPAAHVIALADEAATARLAADIAVIAAPGDVIALHGDLGAGKTAFARAFLRAFHDDPALEVPSPTFTLVQTYPDGRFPVAHIDLYRLGDPGELDEIGFDDAVAEGAVLVEWPERAGDRLPERRLDIVLELAGRARTARLSGSDDWTPRLDRSLAIRAFLDAHGWQGAGRRHVQGDASGRRYERVRPPADNSADEAATVPAGTAIVMDWPPRPPPPPESYDARARRAVHADAFIAVANAVRAAGFSAPEVYAADAGNGFLLLEDLGAGAVVAGGAPVADRYAVAVDVLAALHAAPRPRDLPLPGGRQWTLPAYDRAVLATELGLFTAHVARLAPGDEGLARFEGVWAPLFDRLAAFEASWVLRDVHSPNLLWLGARQGLARIGLIDLQDALYGPSAYDVVSLLQDARVMVAPALEAGLKARYVAARHAAGSGFDEAGFDAVYAILGAQRAMKILGIFTRLAGEGRTGYLPYMSGLREYLARDLTHPVLSPLALWYDAFVTSGDHAGS